MLDGVPKSLKSISLRLYSEVNVVILRITLYHS